MYNAKARGIPGASRWTQPERQGYLAETGERPLARCRSWELDDSTSLFCLVHSDGSSEWFLTHYVHLGGKCAQVLRRYNRRCQTDDHELRGVWELVKAKAGAGDAAAAA
jgi:hypothetical protein